MLALVAFAAHSRLAADRPGPARLTTFYLVVAVGGALGGLLNGVVAPLLFDRVLEYALLIVTVPLLMLGLNGRSSEEVRRRQRVRLLTVAVLLLVPSAGFIVAAQRAPTVSLILVLAGCSVLVWSLTRSPRLLCAVLVVSQLALLVSSDVGVIDRRRTFYGSLSVKATEDQHRLYDGTTLHGTQFLELAVQRADLLLRPIRPAWATCSSRGGSVTWRSSDSVPAPWRRTASRVRRSRSSRSTRPW